MLTIIPLLVFHIGSVYLSYEDIKSRYVTLWILLLVLFVGIISVLPIKLTADLLIPCILFFLVVLSVAFMKKIQAIAWADIAYFLVVLLQIYDLWWMHFICIGILTIVFHHISRKAKNLPFIVIQYGAYVLTVLFSRI